MAETLEIIIKAVDKATGTLKNVKTSSEGLKSAMTGLGVAVGAVTAVVGAGVVAWKATVGPLIDYNKSILDASRATGMGIEQFSRMAEVADDMGVSLGEFEGALKMMTKRGLAPTIESLGQLADSANAMSDPTQRAAYLAEVLGRNWAVLDPLLQQGSRRMTELTGGIEDGIVVTEEEVRQTERLRLALEVTTDQWKAMKNQLGLLIAVPLGERLSSWNEALKRLKSQGIEPTWHATDEMARQIKEDAYQSMADIDLIRQRIGSLPQRTNLEIVTYHWDEQGRPKGYEHTSYIDASGFWNVWSSAVGHFVRGAKSSGAPATPKARGGPLSSGVNIVGEEGPELIIDGTVIPNPETRKIMALGLRPTNSFRGGTPEDVQVGGGFAPISWLQRKWYLGTGGAHVAAHPGMIGEPGEPTSRILDASAAISAASQAAARTVAPTVSAAVGASVPSAVQVMAREQTKAVAAMSQDIVREIRTLKQELARAVSSAVQKVM